MVEATRQRPLWPTWLVATLASFLATCLYGPGILHPKHYQWMLHGDPAQHLLGMAFFLSESWQWPPGSLSSMGGPGSIVFTDSIPWLAITLKLLGWPAWAQPFGLWMVLCHTLAAAFTTRWLQHKDISNTAAVLSGLMACTAPMLLLRAYGHESLMAHFLLPLGLLLTRHGWSPWRWSLLLTLCLGIHAYWVVMLGTWAAATALASLKQRRTTPQKLLKDTVLLSATLLTTAWLLGYTQGDGARSADGLGHYSANMLSWFDPMDWQHFLQQHGRDPIHTGQWSQVVPAIGHISAGQYEGFAWLGTGMLALLIWHIWRRLRQAPTTPTTPTAPTALWLASALLTIMAWSHVWGWGTHTVIVWPLPPSALEMLSVFRASGRFIWALTWLLMLWICLNTAKNHRGTLVLALALAVQWIDLSPKFHEFYYRMRHPLPDAAPALTSPQWSAIMQSCAQLQLLTHNIQGDPLWAAPAWQAAQHQGSIYPAPTARLNPLRHQQVQQQLAQLSQGQGWQNKRLYISWNGSLPTPELVKLVNAARQAMPGTNTMTLEGYTLIVPPGCQPGHGSH